MIFVAGLNMPQQKTRLGSDTELPLAFQLLPLNGHFLEPNESVGQCFSCVTHHREKVQSV